MLFAVINSQKYFPCVSKIFPVLQQNSLCFPCLEKVRTKFPVFPVPWPPCSTVPLNPDKYFIMMLVSISLMNNAILCGNHDNRKCHTMPDTETYKNDWLIIVFTLHRKRKNTNAHSVLYSIYRYLCWYLSRYQSARIDVEVHSHCVSFY